MNSPEDASPKCKDGVPDAETRSALLAKHDLSDGKLQIIKDQLVSVTLTAGTMITSAAPSLSTTNPKRNSSDLVTATDQAVEKMVHTQLTTLYPSFAFLGEETFKDGDILSDKPTFVCDPIDGTLNFIHGFPNTAVSLALTVEKKPVVGVVYNPFRGDLFTAVKGQGAFLTTTSDGLTRKLPLRKNPPPMTSLNHTLLAIEWGSQRSGPNWELRSTMAHTLLSSKASGGAMVHSVRSNGSAALDFCYVAAGMLDAFWEGGVWVWDICAGWVIVEEAGGIVASANPGDWEPALEGRLYFAVRAARREEQEAVVRELWELMGERRFVF